MGNRYDHHTLHNKNFHQKTIFLPMFCSLSIKDIKVNNHHKYQTSAEEPASPKINCIGQVKRNSSLTVLHATTSSSMIANHHESTNLKKLFYRKPLLPINTNVGTRSGMRSCRTNAGMCVRNHSKKIKIKFDNHGKDCAKMVTIGDLHPPLPVAKRAPQIGVGGKEINIWKRRCKGVALKTLQIQHFHLPNNNVQPPPTV